MNKPLTIGLIAMALSPWPHNHAQAHDTGVGEKILGTTLTVASAVGFVPSLILYTAATPFSIIPCLRLSGYPGNPLYIDVDSLYCSTVQTVSSIPPVYTARGVSHGLKMMNITKHKHAKKTRYRRRGR